MAWLAGFLLAAAAGLAQADFYLNSGSFGANRSIAVELGQVGYITNCPGGISDSSYIGYGWADMYIVPAGLGSGASLTDVSGSPNTFSYIIIDEVIGNTAPAGNIPSGRYWAVLDECQDHHYNAGVDSYEEFTVSIPAVIDPLSSARFAASLNASKAAATRQQQHWQSAAAQYAGLFAAFNAITAISIATDPADFILFACTNVDLNTGRVYCSLNDAWGGLMTLQSQVLLTVINQSFYYRGIAADPPDTNYTQLPRLEDGLTVGMQVKDPVHQSALAFGELAAQGTSAAHALLQALERYQGAQQAGAGEDAFRQAREAETQARLLAAAIPRIDAAFAALAAAAEGSGVDFVAIMDQYRATQARVRTSGLTPEERVTLLAKGWTEQNIAAGVADYLARDFSGLTGPTDLSQLAAAMTGDQAAAVSALNQLADAFAGAQTALAAQLRLPYPNANPGGPYVVNEGTPITLDASATTHPDYPANQLSYAWDLDLDGAFDDATGQAPSVTLSRAFDGLIGLKVTAPTGFEDLGYARMTVNEVNTPPVILSASPSGAPVVPYNGRQVFSVTASDPDSDPLTYTWDLDGTAIATGASYTHVANPAQAGEHIVTVTVADGSPLSADTQQLWRMTVVGPDADNDTYPAELDCNDNNPAINPGRTEIPGNGIDDDCDPATLDDNDADDDTYTRDVDCDDHNPAVHPGAPEVCNLIDDNCNGSIDEGYDGDGDGYAVCAGDCDDTEKTVHPGAPEICNLRDDNCNTVIDEGLDADGDGVSQCAGDCDDTDRDRYPGAPEVCDGKDNNCVGGIDEGFDQDGDHVTVCAGDCNDLDATVYPGAPELCDGKDNNCVAGIDEGVSSDADHDGLSICAGDCDDTKDAVHPGATEVCNRIDDNCNVQVDEGFDADGDGYSSCAVPVPDCDDTRAKVFPGAREVLHNGRDDDCNVATADNYARSFVIATDDDGHVYYANSNGDGTWSDFRQQADLNGVIRGAAIADFDNDGDLDFVIPVGTGGNTLSFFLYTNDGTETFTSRMIQDSTAVGSGLAYGMTGGDFNHDGNADFIVSRDGPNLVIGLGDGSGRFALSEVNTGPSNGRGVDVADFDHDGHLDLVRAISSTGQITLLRGNGDGTFTSAGVVADPGSDPYGVVAGDFDEDGNPDLIANNASSGDAYLYAGRGNGTFAAGVLVGSIDFGNYGSYANYDFNADGHQDLITVSYSSKLMRWYPGNGNGTFGAAVTVGTTTGYSLGIAAPPGPAPAADPIAVVDPTRVRDTIGASVAFTGRFSVDDGVIQSYAWNFGDGQTASTMDVTHLFPALEQNYVVTLRVVDDSGKAAIDGTTVSLLRDPPVPDAGGPYVFGESYATGGVYRVPLDGSQSSDDSGKPLTYDWLIRDGFTEGFSGGAIDPLVWSASGATVSAGVASVAGNGNWGPRYLVTKDVFSRATVTRTFTGRVNTPVDPNLMWGLKNTGSDFNYTQFTYAIYFSNNGWVYIYEDGSSRGNLVTYTEGQPYDVRIDLKPDTGAEYFIRPVGTTEWIWVYSSTYSAATQFLWGATVHSGTIGFDDFVLADQHALGVKPQVVFDGKGDYGLDLTVTDQVGQTGTETTLVSLVTGAPPVARPGGPYRPGEASANCNKWTVQFNGSASSDDNGIYAYSWTFGDTGTGSGVGPAHTYAAPGTYNVGLTVTDQALLTGTAATTVTTTPGALPTAVPGGPYAVNESAALNGSWTVQFDGSGSFDDVGLCDYSWVFGDGGTGTGARPTHAYAAAGTYNVTLTVRDHAYQSHSAATSLAVSASAPPVPNPGGPYAADEGAAKAGLWTVLFNAGRTTDDYGIWKYEWNFGDNTTGTGVSPTHQYAAAGTYTVTLTATDYGRQAVSATTPAVISVNAPPVADAGPARVVEVGQPVGLTAAASTDDFGIYTYQWDAQYPVLHASFDTPLAGDLWSWANAVQTAGTVRVTGTGSWGPAYLVTTPEYTRVAGDSYTGRIVVQGSGNRYVMWGLKDTGSNYSYTQFYYAIYFTDGTLRVYESGADRGQKGTYTDGTSYDVRIDVKATGATYYIRPTGTATWTQVYDSNVGNAAALRPGATVYSGTATLDDFAAPGSGTAPARYNSRAEASFTYNQPGTYHPTVRVTDHALQSTTDATVVTVVAGSAPTANAGGPYLTNEDIPTRFNARASTDDFGIRSYTWDFGDGQGLTTYNPWVDHRYTAAGSYTATLTVSDYSGHTGSNATTVTVRPDPVVAAVPWAFSGGIEVPHDSWSGRETTLKGVAWSLHGPLTYRWDFGDSSAPVSGTVASNRAIEAKHVYTGPDGAPFVATLTVTDSAGRSASDHYLIRLRAKSLDIEINTAIDEGLWWLHKNQNLGTFAAGTYGNAAIDHGWWDNGGGYGTTAWVASPTASAVQAYQINAHLELGEVREDPYVETVARGLRHLPTRMQAITIGVQTYGDPDTNGNTLGIETTPGSDTRPPYEVGQVMDALVASGSRDTYAITGPINVRDRRYYDLVVDMADAYFWGQYDDATVGGGWRYSWNSGPDNSVAQWGAIGLLAAQDVWGIQVPQWVKDRNSVWLSYSYNGTGFGYTGSGNGTNTTPSGLVQLAFDDKVGVNDPATPGDDRDPRWATAEDYIASQWSKSFWFANSSVNNRFSYYGYYSFSKAMRTAHPHAITNLRSTGLDWFKDDVNGIARRLVNRQQTDGGWPLDNDPGGTYVGYDLTSAWSVIMLTPTLFQQPPVADAGEDRVWGLDVPITFDGSRSYHLDPFRSILRYEWDLDGDGNYDTASSGPTYEHTYTSANYPPSSLPRTITARLRVTDNNAPALTDSDSVSIILAVPPHPPVAVGGGPYRCTAGLSCMLDGSGSFDIDPTDYITAWDWDTDNDGSFENAQGATVAVVFGAIGRYNVGLRVRDNAVLNDLNHNGVQDPAERLEDFDYVVVEVVANEAPGADPGGPYTVNEGGVVQLSGTGSDPNGDPLVYVWDLDGDGIFGETGAGAANGAETGAAPAFSAATLDGPAVVQVRLRVADGLLTAESPVSVTVVNVAPTAEAGGPYSVTEGGSVVVHGTASDPAPADVLTLVWDLDGDGTFGETGAAAARGDETGASPVFDAGGLDGPATYTIGLRVTDDDSGAGTDSAAVTIVNAGPVVTSLGNRTVEVGQPLSAALVSFTDVGRPDLHVATITWGDGASGAGTVTEAAGSGTVTGSHTYGAVGSDQVTVTVTDDDGALGSATLMVTVTGQPNQPPQADAGSDRSVNEGAVVTLTGGGSDGDGTLVQYRWDLDGDGVFGETGAAAIRGDEQGREVVFSAAGLDGPTSVLVRLRVTDDDGADGTDEALITVDNVAPSVEAGADRQVVAGTPVAFAGSFTDPAPADTHRILWTVDGAPFSSDTLTPGYTPTVAGLYLIGLRVTDDDGGVGSDTLTLRVDAPTQPVRTISDLYAGPKDGKVSLVWTAVAGAQSYSVYRKSGTGAFALIAAGHACTYCTYLDQTVVNGTTYTYVVTSLTGGVESLQSNAASATPVAAREPPRRGR